MEKPSKEELNEGIQNWLAIIDYADKEQTAWCRRNITELRRKMKKEKNNLS